MPMTNLYSVYDTEAQTVVGPIVAELRHAPAARMFAELLNDKKTIVGQYPQHFELKWVGRQNTETGAIEGTGEEPPVIARGKDWLNQRNRAQLEETDRQLEVQAP